jgi:hypothetical protein
MPPGSSPINRTPESGEASPDQQSAEQRTNFDDATRHAEANAKAKGREAAQEFSNGIMRGFGVRAGQAVWDFLKEHLRD